MVTIEMDCIKAWALPHVKVLTFGADSDRRGEDNTTSSKVVSVDDRTPRSCCINVVRMAVAILSNDNHRILLTWYCWDLQLFSCMASGGEP